MASKAVPVVSPKQLRSFGLLVGGVFALIGFWPAVFRKEDPRIWSLAVAGVLVVAGLLIPKALGPVYRVWMVIGHVLGFINTRIILGVIFYVVFTPTGILMRWLKRDPMRRQMDRGLTTYRVPRTPRPGTHMKHQF